MQGRDDVPQQNNNKRYRKRTNREMPENFKMTDAGVQKKKQPRGLAQATAAYGRENLESTSAALNTSLLTKYNPNRSTLRFSIPVDTDIR